MEDGRKAYPIEAECAESKVDAYNLKVDGRMRSYVRFKAGTKARLTKLLAALTEVEVKTSGLTAEVQVYLLHPPGWTKPKEVLSEPEKTADDEPKPTAKKRASKSSAKPKLEAKAV